MGKSIWEKYSEEDLKQYAAQSVSYSDFLQKLGYAKATAQTSSTQLVGKIKKIYPDFENWFKAKGYIGQRFGKYIIKEIIGEGWHTKWLCHCDCGNEKIEKPHRLISGHTKSCDCLKTEDLTGKIFENWTVLKKDTDSSNTTHTNWICRCKCGNIRSIRSDALINGNSCSCGCLKISKGEKLIKNILEKENIKHKQQFSFIELNGDKFPLRFDFAVFENQKLLCLIEFQGEQHYKEVKTWGGKDAFEKRQKYDILKEEYCGIHNIKLIKIPYWDFDKINAEYLQQKIFNGGERSALKRHC